MTFDAKAWLAWTASALAILVAIDDPIVSVVAAATLVATGVVFAAAGPEGRAGVVLLKIGIAFVLVRIVLFALTGHTGPTTLFTLPQVRLPWWAGSFALGGRITGEVVAQAAAEGVRIAALLACAGVFLAVVPTERVLRILPRFLFEVALVVGIALAFVPSLLRRAAEIRDAQRLRGVRARGVRALRPVIVPLLAGAVEGALELAASMESRGYARAHGADPPGYRRARLALLGGIVALAIGGGTMLFGTRPWAVALTAAGAGTVAVALRRTGASVRRTRMRAARLDAWDRALIATSALTVAAAFLVRALPGAQWYPYPALHAPRVDLRLIALALTPAVPILLGVARAMRLDRASAVNDERARALEAIR